ncbi:hypothetical protein [Burkholderia ubonensis]|uniref:hypothetical protein n=1 Tax=Burkholderia ubonensis TaxID=101571 RepID=UPI000ACA11C8|nr:hypothetical protein [Burkholderia ubonensis]
MDHSQSYASLFTSPEATVGEYFAVAGMSVRRLFGLDGRVVSFPVPAEPERVERPSHELGCASGALPARPYLPHYAPRPRCFACGGEVRADWRCVFCGRDNV